MTLAVRRRDFLPLHLVGATAEHSGMTVLLFEAPTRPRRTGNDFIQDAVEAAATARARAETARLLAQVLQHPGPRPERGELRRLRREAAEHEADARVHEEAIAVMRDLMAALNG